MAPSQSTAAVAGVQKLSRQHNSLVPFFQVMPLGLTQLSTVWAPATVANAAAATSIATLFNFFMVLLLGKKAAATRRIFIRRSGCESSKALLTLCHSLI